MCERFCGCWGDKLYPWVEPLFQAALLPLGNGGTQEGPPPSREEPGSQEVSLGREQVEPGSKPPQSPTVAPKDLESDFITPRNRGKRRLSSDSSNSEGESLDSRTPLKMTRVGEDVMADTATTPPASPTDTIIPAATSGHDNVGKKSPQPADKPKTAPTVQKDNPAPKLRQDYPSRKAGKREQQFRSQPDGNSRRKQFQPSTRALPGGDPRRRRRIGQVRQARTMAPQPASQQRGGSSALH